MREVSTPRSQELIGLQRLNRESIVECRAHFWIALVMSCTQVGW